MAIFPLNYPILLRSMGASALMKNLMGSEVLGKRIGEILTAIISPKDTNRGLKHIKN